MTKHLFIINPVAGKHTSVDTILPKVKALQGAVDGEVRYEITLEKGHGHKLVKETLAALPAEDRLRVYAVGGDGTLFGVVNGGIGDPRFSVAMVPTGSGNDFIKTFPQFSREDFLNIPALVAGKEQTLDSLRCGKFTSLNIISAGFDAATCKYMQKYKKVPGISGPMAYKLALVDAILHSRKNYFRILADGEEIEDGTHPYLFALGANGRYYGGGFCASPLSIPDDGKMDVVTVETVSVFSFARLVGAYSRGEHINNPKMPMVHHRLCNSMQLLSEQDIVLNVDGEMLEMKNPLIQIVPQSIRIILPAL